MKKLFIKICKLLGFEILDQNNFYSPTLGKNLNEELSIINEKSIILVGHSSFFLEMMKKHIDDASFQGEQKKICDNLKEYKLDNGACLHIRVTFDQLTWKGNWSAQKIVHAELLFGSQLKTVKE